MTEDPVAEIVVVDDWLDEDEVEGMSAVFVIGEKEVRVEMMEFDVGREDVAEVEGVEEKLEAVKAEEMTFVVEDDEVDDD